MIDTVTVAVLTYSATVDLRTDLLLQNVRRDDEALSISNDVP